MNLSRLITNYVDPLKPVVRRIVPQSVARPVYRKLQDIRIARQPDRRFMREAIVPALIGQGTRRVSIIGTRSYSQKSIRQLEAAGVEVWSCDIDPEAARFGVRGRHFTVDVCQIMAQDMPAQPDTVLVNGVLGYGVNTQDQCRSALGAIREMLATGGRIVLGWNRDRCPDVDGLVVQSGFVPTRLGALGTQKNFEGSTHVYAFACAH